MSRQSPTPSKLPKFLQKGSARDRSKSITDPAAPATASTSSFGSSTSSDVSSPASKPRKSSKFLVMRDKDKDKDKDEKARRSTDENEAPSKVDEPPVIVEPISASVSSPRPRTRSERPLSTPSHSPNHLSSSSSGLYSPSHSTSSSRIGDLPTRLSGWFSHTFSTSSTDLSLPALLSQSHGSMGSPKGKGGGASALLTAAKHGKGHLDKAMRYLMDSDSMPDRCAEPIWIMGVRHPGYEPPPPQSQSQNQSRASSIRSSASTSSQLETEKQQNQNPAAHWPPVFYADFTSRVWLTYRAQFTPIRDGRLADLSGEPPSDGGAGGGAGGVGSPTTVRARPWGWVGGGEKGWTSDSGWGCMLRTGQSMLASALVHLHLGRDWRRPPQPLHTADYATYVQILTWFFDTPSPEAPFSVHRMALAGKELGKDVGQWFGPSTAAGAIKTLVNAFPEAGLGVSVATDGVLFQTDVFTASHTGASSVRSPKRHTKALSSAWGDRPVLLLIGVRLGLEGVNPIYYETIKLLYTFPQSVGIAGGRPSSSYYFVGSQADNLFYLDPHHARPAVPLRPAPPVPAQQGYRETTPESDRDKHRPPPTSPSSVRTGSSTFSYHAPLSPSPLQKEFSTGSDSESSGLHSNNHSYTYNYNPRASRSPPPSVKQQQHTRFRSASASQSHSPVHSSHSPSPSDPLDLRDLTYPSHPSSGLDPLQEHYVTAYPPSELKTFHCERVRKMPLSGLDPSMLIGFLCKDEADWVDLRKRVAGLPRVVFSVQDEPPVWGGGGGGGDWDGEEGESVGLESISEPDDLDMDFGVEEGEGLGVDHDDDQEEEEEEEDGEEFFDTRSVSTSSASASGSGSGSGGKGRRGRSEEVDTEEDPVDPITPLPNARFSIDTPASHHGKKVEEQDEREMFEEGDIEDDWVDPSIPTPTPGGPYAPAHAPSPPAATEVRGSNGKAKTGRSRKGRKGEVPVPVPLVKIPAPPLTRHHHHQQQQQQEHFPFPVSQRSADETSPTQQEQRSRNSSGKGAGKRMHTARARDGGRTQSGGVKGILTDD
ncbi:peptidase family C54-domain-containing protein [Lyophyllum atratum]|nr:peptidase family C54-domain-containing protein [Lyophyllum atratum]